MRPSSALLACCLFIGGCTASDGTRQEPPAPVSTPVVTPAAAPVQQPEEFVTRIDTVEVADAQEPVIADSTLAEGEVRFSIQIGAFREPANASIAQAHARERYGLPVLLEFQERAGLYQIRIGSFATREEARIQLTRMKTEYQAEYKDSFIVQAKR
jgi:cell division septation protein DedD